MHRFSTARSAVAFTVAAVSLAAPAVAGAENCPDTSFTVLAAADCRGAFVGTLSGSAAETAALGTHFGSAEGVATTIRGNPQNLGDAALYVAVVPEPGVPALLTAGLLALAWRARRRARYPIPSCDQ